VPTSGSNAFAANSASDAAIAAATGVGSTAAGQEALASGDRSVAIGNSSSASATGATALGSAARANASESVAVGGGSNVTASDSVAVGASAQASGVNSVALGANSSDGGEANVVSLGSAAQTRRLTNVAAGVNQNDGVNLGQLNGSVNQAVSTAQAYTDARLAAVNYDLSTVRQDVRMVRRDAEGATASAMALAGIPQTFERGRGMVGIGVGTWQGESAIAVGISKATDDGHFVLKAGASYNSRSQGGANAGVGWAF